MHCDIVCVRWLLSALVFVASACGETPTIEGLDSGASGHKDSADAGTERDGGLLADAGGRTDAASVDATVPDAKIWFNDTTPTSIADYPYDANDRRRTTLTVGQTVFLSACGPAGNCGEDWSWAIVDSAGIAVPALGATSTATVSFEIPRHDVFLVRLNRCSGNSCELADALSFGARQSAPYEWVDVVPSTSPRFGDAHDMTYDPVRRVVVLYGAGGGISGEFYDETWEYDSMTWSQRPTQNTPGRRAYHQVIYDPSSRGVLLYGGDDARPGEEQTTWLYNGVDWRTVATATAPVTRAVFLLTYDLVRREVIGVEWRTKAVWSFDGMNWRRHAAQAPAQIALAMTFDSINGRVILLGSDTTAGQQTMPTTTWSYDGQTWTRVSTSSTPPALSGTRMVYDASRQNVVMFGGLDPNERGRGTNALWAFDGTDWRRIRTLGARPSIRFRHAMTYDNRRRRIVTVGGYTTWPGGRFARGTWELR